MTEVPEVMDQDLEATPETVRPETKPKAELATIPRNAQELATMEREVEMIGKLAELSRKRTEQILRLCYPGDCVAFSGGQRNVVCLSAAAAMRIIPKLGIEITENKCETVKHSDDRGEWIEFVYTALAWYKGVAYPIQSISHTRMKFFAVVEGGLKPLAEVAQSDVRTAGYRGLFKEACKVCLGLHQIPYDVAAQVLGSDGIAGYKFQGAQRSSSTAAAPTSETQTCPDCGKPMKLRNKKDGSGKFWGCSGYPDCKKIVGYSDKPKAAAPAEPSDAQDPEENVRNQIWDMVGAMANNDEAKMRSMLKVQFACLDITTATGKALSDLLAKVIAAHQRWEESQK